MTAAEFWAVLGVQLAPIAQWIAAGVGAGVLLLAVGIGISKGLGALRATGDADAKFHARDSWADDDLDPQDYEDNSNHYAY